MRQQEWGRGVVGLIAESVVHYRTRKRPKMSARALANACAALGFPALTRGVIANLENGDRDSITVPEWLALAAALGVPPLLLLFPLGRASEMEPLPDTVISPWAALSWAEHGRIVGFDEPFAEDAITIAEFRRHEEFVSMWTQSRHEARRVRELLGKTEEELQQLGEDAVELRVELADRERRQERAVLMLRQVRRTLRSAGLMPPNLPRQLQVVDDGASL